MEIIASNKYKGFQPHHYATDKRSEVVPTTGSASKSKKSKTRSSKKVVPVSPATKNNSGGKKVRANSETVSMLFKKIMRTKGDHKILQDFEELARGLCKLLEISSVEIVLIDDNVCNLLKLTEKQ